MRSSTLPRAGAGARLPLPVRSRLLLSDAAPARADPLTSRCASCISPTSGFRSSAPTASSRWRRATRWRRAATTCTLVVRPDTHAPPRDPFAFYGLPPDRGLTIERAPVAGPAPRGGSATSTFALGPRDRRATRRTSSSRAISASRRCCCGCPPRCAPPLVYESHGYAPDVAAALPRWSRPRPPPSAAASCAGWREREARVWQRADGLRHDHARRSRDELDASASARGRGVAVVPDGVAHAERDRPRSERGRRAGPADSVALCRPSVSVEGRGPADRGAGGAAGRRRADRRRPRARAGPGARAGARGAARTARRGSRSPDWSSRRRCAARLRERRRAGAAESGVGDLEPLHVAAEAVRVHGGAAGRSSRRDLPALREVLRDGRERAARRARQRAGAGRRRSGASWTIRRSPRGSRAPARGRRRAIHVGRAGPSGSRRCSTDVSERR